MSGISRQMSGRLIDFNSNNFYQQQQRLLFQMRSLEQFANSIEQPLFPDATTLPAFFQSNLIDPARVVKAFLNDPQSNIRVFYYQYLKLCFQIQSVDFEGYISKIQQIINNQDFKFVFYEDDDPQIFSDLQFKQLISQFFGLLGQGNTTVQQCLGRCPIMDTVFIYFFRAILILTGKTDSLDSFIEREDLFNFLCNYFGVDISIHDRCIKFVQTDIFVYEEDPKEVFMAYMDYDKNNNQIPSHDFQAHQASKQAYFQAHQASKQAYFQAHQASKQAQKPAITHLQTKLPEQVKNPPAYPANSSRRRQTTQINTSYISSQFLDYTSPNHQQNLNGLVQTSKQLQESAIIERPKPSESNVYMSANIEQKKHKNTQPLVPISLPKQPEPSKIEQIVLPSHNNNTLPYSSGSNQQSYGVESVASKSGTHNSTGLTQLQSSLSQNHSSPSSKIGQNKYQTDFKWEPSKQPSYSQNTVKNQNISGSPFEKPPSNKEYQAPIYQPNAYQSPSTFDSYRTKQSSYTSSASQAQKYSNVKPPSSELPNAQPPYQQKYTGMHSGLLNGKNPFNLDVSLQFTNSLTMKAMAEPFKTNVRSIRQRARNYRDSLTSFLK